MCVRLLRTVTKAKRDAGKKRTLMYEMVFSSLGLTTFSSALTRRLVVLMAVSSAKKDVY